MKLDLFLYEKKKLLGKTQNFADYVFENFCFNVNSFFRLFGKLVWWIMLTEIIVLNINRQLGEVFGANGNCSSSFFDVENEWENLMGKWKQHVEIIINGMSLA